MTPEDRVCVLSEDVRMTKIYVGNLPFTATEPDVRELFAQHGTVESVALPTDRETGRPRGFGFVEMPQADAQRAMQALNGFNMGGRPLRVNEAQDRPRTGGGGGPRGGGGGRPGGGYGGGGGGGGYGGGGGGGGQRRW
jgi:cold-inducible RNA-binding protein